MGPILGLMVEAAGKTCPLLGESWMKANYIIYSHRSQFRHWSNRCSGKNVRLVSPHLNVGLRQMFSVTCSLSNWRCCCDTEQHLRMLLWYWAASYVAWKWPSALQEEPQLPQCGPNIWADATPFIISFVAWIPALSPGLCPPKCRDIQESLRILIFLH